MARKFLTLLISTLVLAFSMNASAAPSGVSYQGRILKPDGTPLTGHNVQFRLQIRAPDSNNCLMYEELQTANLSQTSGNFALTLSDGLRQDSSGFGLDRVFANRGTFSFDPTTCSSGNDYTPSSSDGRSLQVYFKDETMSVWEPMPAQRINFVPFAFEAKQIAGFTSQNLLKFNFATPSVKNTSPLSEAEYDKLIALIAGTSGDYERPGRLNNVVVPTFGSGDTGKVLGWNGSAWTVSDSVPADSITTTKIIDGTITGADLSSSVVINTTGAITTSAAITTSGTVASNVSTSRDFRIYDAVAAPNEHYVSLKVPAALSQNYNYTWPVDYGTANQVLTSNGAGVLTWAAAAAASQWSNGAAGAVYYNGGNVGIGTATPATKLDVNGNVNAGGITVSNGATQLGAIGNSNGHGRFWINDGAGTTQISLGPWNSTDANYMALGTGLLIGNTGLAKSTVDVSGNLTVGSGYAKNNAAPTNGMIVQGNVGIGTAAPIAKLHIDGGDVYLNSGSFSANDFSSGTYTQSGTRAGVIGFNVSNSSATDGRASYLSASVRNTANNAQASYFGSVSATAGFSPDTVIGQSVAGSNAYIERLRISSNGDVGIGTIAPNGKLDVKGSIVMSGATSGYVGFKPAAAAGGSIWELPAVDGSVDQFLKTNGSGVLAWASPSSGPWNKVISDINYTAGFVGIGTATPADTLDVVGGVRATSTSANAFVVGQTGVTNPAFRVDSSAASSVTGIVVTSGTASAGAKVSASSTSSANAKLTLESKGLSGVDVSMPGSTATFGVYAAGTQLLSLNSGLYFAANSNSYSFNPTNLTAGGSNPRFSLNMSGPETGLQSTFETPGALFNFGILRQHQTGAIPAQREFRIVPSTHSFVGASTITNADGLTIDGPPNAGTNSTITTASAIRVPTSALSAGVVNSYGLNITATTGATNNYAATFMGGNVGVGTTTPLSRFEVVGAGNFSAALPGSAGIANRVPASQGSLISWNDSGGFGETSISNHRGTGGGGIWFNLFNASGAFVSTPMMINGSGNIGMGTTSPTAKLDVAGTVNATAFTINGAPISAGSSQWTTAVSDIYFNTGNVGIGTATPGYKLDVNGAVRGTQIYATSAESRFGSGSFTDPAPGVYDAKFGGNNGGIAVKGQSFFGGNVGVGTSTPSMAMHINLGGTPTGSYSAGTGDAFMVSKTSGSGDWARMYLLGGSGSSGNSTFFFGNGDNPQRGSIASWGGQDFTFRTNNADRMYISPSGSVGIGTTNPSASLHVAGSTEFDGNMGVGSVNAVSAKLLVSTVSNANGLQVSNSVATGTGYAGNFSKTGAATNNIGIYATATGATNNYAAIFDQGKVGIGTTSPLYALDLRSGDAFFATSPTNHGVFLTSNGAGGVIQAAQSGGSSTDLLVNPSGGNVMVGNAGTPSEKLEVAGNVKATAFLSTSDIRLKKNVETTPGLDFIRKLTGVKWQWKSNDQTDAGVIAQDVERVMPYAVVTDAKSGFKAVKYNALIAPLIESTKELYGMCSANAVEIAGQGRAIASVQSENAKLKVENQELKARLDSVEARMRAIEAKLAK